jgi:galactokinase
MPTPTDLRRAFIERFGREPQHIVRAPGRVNLIGEHTDYNDGFVLPVAIEREVRIAASPTTDRILTASSVQLGESANVDLSGSLAKSCTWLDYVTGVASVLIGRCNTLSGCDLLIDSDVPVGSGLSSSAALEVAACLALERCNGLQLAPKDRAGIAFKSETGFIGLQCGTMDMTISACAREGCALLIDTRSGDQRAIPIPFDKATIVISNTNRPHELVTSAYNERCAECRAAVAILQTRWPAIISLRDAKSGQLEAIKQLESLELLDKLKLLEGIELNLQTIYRRARHVVTENDRTVRGAELLATGDVEAFGKLMIQSHESLRDDYEVSCDELDTMVRLALELPGVYGSRLTGAGFGGCTVSLVEPSQVEAFIAHVGSGYLRETGIQAEFIVTNAAAGASGL